MTAELERKTRSRGISASKAVRSRLKRANYHSLGLEHLFKCLPAAQANGQMRLELAGKFPVLPVQTQVQRARQLDFANCLCEFVVPPSDFHSAPSVDRNTCPLDGPRFYAQLSPRAPRFCAANPVRSDEVRLRQAIRHWIRMPRGICHIPSPDVRSLFNEVAEKSDQGPWSFPYGVPERVQRGLPFLNRPRVKTLLRFSISSPLADCRPSADCRRGFRSLCRYLQVASRAPVFLTGFRSLALRFISREC